MIKVTVEVDGSQTQVQTSAGNVPAAAAPPDTGDAVASVIAKAAATGAISAGPAPAHGGARSAAPLASSIHGATAGAPAQVGISAGAAPEHPPGS
jgi:hypothetical protein